MWETWGGWLAGGSGVGRGGTVEEEEAWAVVLLGLGLLLGLLGGCLHLWDKADGPRSKLWAIFRRHEVWHDQLLLRLRTFCVQSTHLVGLGLSVLRVVFLVCLCLCVLLRLLGLLVLLLIVHSLFFLQRPRDRLLADWMFTLYLQLRDGSPLRIRPSVAHLCCLLGLWFRLGWGRFLWKERESDQEAATVEYICAFFANLHFFLFFWRYQKTFAHIRHFLDRRQRIKL